jgi:hypothetical protein
VILGFRIILKSWEKAGVLTSMLLILFYSFGHAANAIESWFSPKDMSFDIQFLLWIWIFVFLLFSFFFIRARLPEKTTQFLNIIAGVLMIFPMLTIILTMVANAGNRQSGDEILADIRGQANAEQSMPDLSQSEMPDIYYIIFDAYERADLLREFYEYDNSSFIEALEERDFYVAPDSRSNYMSTTYSLNTTLNLTYFHELPLQIFRTARYNLQTNYVSDFLRELGYQIIVFDSGTGDSNNQYADKFILPPSVSVEEKPLLTPFEQLMLRTTVGLLIFKGESLENNPEGANDVVISSVNRELDLRRERINNAFTHLPDYAVKEGQYFVFAHIYSPHIPFLFGPGGSELDYHEDLTLYWYEVEPENFVEYYGYQIDYLNQEVLTTIDAILSGTKKPVVIILQSDHGDDKYLDWDAPTTQGVNVRSANLNAIYFSDTSYDELYPSITPVNTFRVLLNHWFGTQYPLLEDKVFFHEHPLSTPFNAKPEFLESCAEFEICLPAVQD